MTIAQSLYKTAKFIARHVVYGRQLIDAGSASLPVLPSAADVHKTAPLPSRYRLLFTEHPADSEIQHIYFDSHIGVSITAPELPPETVHNFIATRRAVVQNGAELLQHATRFFATADTAVRCLEAGCFEGCGLDLLARRTRWQLAGIEPHPFAAARAAKKGHAVWNCKLEDAPLVIPSERRFDLIFLRDLLQRASDPVRLLRRMSAVLRSGGLLILSTPNFDSRQREIFGAAWAHWRAPFHRFLFSKKSLASLATMSHFTLRSAHSFSHPAWTARSIYRARENAALAAPAAAGSASALRALQHLARFARMPWDERGRGDYTLAIFRKL